MKKTAIALLIVGIVSITTGCSNSPVAQWQTYRDSSGLFSLQFPKEGKIIDGQSGRISLPLSNVSTKLQNKEFTISSLPPPFATPQNCSWQGLNSSNPQPIKAESVGIGGMTFLREVVPNTPSGNTYATVVYSTYHSGMCVQIDMSVSPADITNPADLSLVANEDKVMPQILSTLKFAN